MITDPLEIHYNEKREKFYVKQGNSTFYDIDKRSWIMFDTEAEAQAWINGYLYREEAYERTRQAILNPYKKENETKK